MGRGGGRIHDRDTRPGPDGRNVSLRPDHRTMRLRGRLISAGAFRGQSARWPESWGRRGRYGRSDGLGEKWPAGTSGPGEPFRPPASPRFFGRRALPGAGSKSSEIGPRRDGARSRSAVCIHDQGGREAGTSDGGTIKPGPITGLTPGKREASGEARHGRSTAPSSAVQTGKYVAARKPGKRPGRTMSSSPPSSTCQGA